MKRIALLAVLFLSGCALQGPTVYDHEVGQVRQAADQKITQGKLQWHNGTGIVYTRQNNQCGKNCANQAELGLKMDRERAAQEAAGNPEWERIVKREKDAYKRLAVYNKCQRGMDIHVAGYQDRYEKAILEYGFNSKKAREAATEFVKVRNSSGRIVNECVEYGLKQNDSN